VSNSTKHKLFIADDKKYTLFGMTFSFEQEEFSRDIGL